MNKADKVYDIEWDVDFDEIINTIMEWTPLSVCIVFESIEPNEWNTMSDKEKYDFVDNQVNCPKDTSKLVANIMDLPTEVDLPFDVDTTTPNWDEKVYDYLSYEYGYCVGGFKLKD